MVFSSEELLSTTLTNLSIRGIIYCGYSYTIKNKRRNTNIATGRQPIFNPEEASKGAYRSILGFTGDFVELTDVEEGIYGDQVKAKFENVEITEMADGEPEPELEDGTFTIFINYCPKGKVKPAENSGWVKGFLATSKEQSVKLPPDARKPQRVNMRKQAVPLGFTPRGGTEEATATVWAFVASGAVGSVQAADIGDLVKELILGKNLPQAKRTLMLDQRTKRYPEYKDAIDDGSICELIGVQLDANGVYTEL